MPALAADLRLKAVNDIARTLSGAWSLEEVLTLVMDRLAWILDAERAALYLVEGDELVARHTVGDTVREIRVQFGQGLAGWVAQTGRGTNVKNAYDDSRFDSSWDAENDFVTESMLCQPVFDRHENVIAVAQVLNKRRGYFTVDDESLLATVVSMAAISIVNARLVDELGANNVALQRARVESADRAREIDSLYELERDAVRAPTFDAAVAAVLERIAVVVGADAAEIALPVAGQGCVLHRYRPAEDRMQTVPLQTKGLHARVFEGEPICDPCRGGDASMRRLAAAHELPWTPQTGLCVPLQRDDELVGSLGVYWMARDAGGLTDDKVRFIELVGQQIGHALGHRLARTQAEHQDRLAAIGGALAGVVHDLKTPMTVASGYVQLLKTEQEVDERTRLANGVLEQLRRMNDMAREVLGFARGDVQILPRKTLVPEWTGQVETALQQIFEGSDVAVGVTCEERGAVRMDAGKLLRVVQNLARNSREAFGQVDPAQRPAPARFSLRIFSDGVDLVMVTADNGPGVPREFEHRMFDAFATHGTSEGTGLGLAMVKQVAEAHLGSIQYRPTDGGGATFELRIRKDLRPASEVRPQPPPSLPAEAGGGAASG